MGIIKTGSMFFNDSRELVRSTCQQENTRSIGTMRILVLNGSPKKKSDTYRLTDAFLKGLNKEQNHEVEVINVIEKNIAPCQGCFGCWQKQDGHCVIPDDQNAILDLYVKALTLSPETIASLEVPMIPKEMYIQNVNAM